MWDTNIGDGDYGNIAWPVKDYSIISENLASYWFHDSEVLMMGCKIGKETVQGKEVASMLSNGCTEDALEAYLRGLLFKHCDYLALCSAIKNALHNSFVEGQLSKIKEIKFALEIY